MRNIKIPYLLIPLVVLMALFFYKGMSQFQKPWKSYEGKVCSFGGCYISEMNQKYNYWLTVAVRRRDPELCNNVEGLDNGDYQTSKEEAVYFCKARYGGRVGDADYCMKLDSSVKYKGSSTQQYVCFQEMLENVSDIKACDKFPTDTYPVNSKYECYSKVAEKNRDATVCQKIPEQGYDRNFRGSRKNCLITVGKKLNNFQVCQNLTESWVKNECIKEIELVK